jgi:hypothetical protein
VAAFVQDPRGLFQPFSASSFEASRIRIENNGGLFIAGYWRIS